MKKFLSLLLAVLACLACVSCGSGEENEMFPIKTEMKTDGQLYTGGEVQFPASLWETPASERYEDLDYEDLNIRAYFIDSVQNTKVFAFVGIPEGASAENKVPGIVLVHGGDGTAYYEWVDYWVKRGYAAIAMDTEGRMPLITSLMTNNNRTESIKEHGPANTALTDMNLPVEEQWAYHATASVIVSNSFLRSFECVDTSRIGITGISYGAFLTCQAVAYDDRYVFAAPVYGSLEQKQGQTTFGTLVTGRAGELWDDVGILEGNTTPFLYLNGNKDYWFSVESTTACRESTMYASMSLKYAFAHGQPQGALEVPEVYAFADYFCKGDSGLPVIEEQPTAENPTVQVRLPKDVSIGEVIGYYTESDVLDMNTEWRSVDGTADGNTCSVQIPEGAKYYYINIVDSRELEISTDVIAM